MNRDPNQAFIDRNRHKRSFDKKDSHVISTKGIKTLLTYCPVCQASMSVDVRGSNSIDIKAIRCDDCSMEEMGG